MKRESDNTALNQFVSEEGGRIAGDLLVKVKARGLPDAANILVLERAFLAALVFLYKGDLRYAHEAMEMVMENVTTNLLNVEQHMKSKKA